MKKGILLIIALLTALSLNISASPVDPKCVMDPNSIDCDNPLN